MRTQLITAVCAGLLSTVALAQATKMSSETKVESTATTPTSKSEAMTDKTVQRKSDGSSTTVVEHTTTQQADYKPTQKTHTKQTVERSPTGSVTKSETVNESK